MSVDDFSDLVVSFFQALSIFFVLYYIYSVDKRVKELEKENEKIKRKLRHYE